MKKKNFTKKLNKVGTDRLRIRLTIDKGKIIDVVVQYETFLDNNWIAIVRYDMAHGFFHRDLLTPKGEKIKTPIDISDLDMATIYAEQDIKDKWELYKRNYIKQIKK
jgi:hypothetical protein